MPVEPRMYRLTVEDANRVDHIIERISQEIKEQGIKPVKHTTLLRALIFYGQQIETENLIEAIKKAQIYA